MQRDISSFFVRKPKPDVAAPPTFTIYSTSHSLLIVLCRDSDAPQKRKLNNRIVESDEEDSAPAVSIKVEE